MSSRRRAGFSLMEVLLATGILLVCLVILGELAAVGRRHARDAEQMSAAQLVCRSFLNEILCGAAPLESQGAVEVPELPGWSQSVQVESRGKFGLSSVTVTVTRTPPGTLDALDTPTGGTGKSFALTRWVYVPERSSAALDGQWEGEFP